MSLFGKILGKLGFGGAAEKTATAAPMQGQQGQQIQQPQQQTQFVPPAAQPAAPAPMSPVDVSGKLDSLAASHPEKLNWKASIVDLLKLLGLDSSIAARKELAVELGCPPDKMGDSAQMNMWLHKAVLQKLAANGGNVPKELLD